MRVHRASTVSGGSLRERSQRTMMQVVVGQLVVTGGAALLGSLWGMRTGYSALVGGLVGVIPNYYLALRLARRQRSASAEQALRAIYIGELIKIAFTAALFVIAIMLLKVNFLVAVLGYLATVTVHWIAFLRADVGEVPRTLARGESGPTGD